MLEHGTQPANKTVDRVLLVVFLTVFLDMIGFGLILPLLPLYVQNMGGSPQAVGWIFSSFAVAQLLATPALGRLSDRFGRRPVILVSLVGNAVAMIIFALADQLWLLFLSRLLAGATAGNLSACQAAIADVTTREDRARGMGRLGAGIGLGMVLGPVMGGALSGLGTWAPPSAAAGLALVDFALAYFWMPETLRKGSDPVNAGTAPAHPRTTLWATITHPRLGRVMAIYFLSFFSLTNLQVAVALLAFERFEWGAQEAGYLFGLFGLLILVIQGGLIGRFARRWGELNLVTAGSVLVASGMFLISVAGVPALLLGGVALFGCGFAVSNPSLSSLASRYAPDHQQGEVLGLAQSAGGLARALGPTVAGFLFVHYGSGAPFVEGGVVALLWGATALSLASQDRNSLPFPAGSNTMTQRADS